MLSPDAASSVSKPENIIKETLVRLFKEADQIGYSMKLLTEVGNELSQQIQQVRKENPQTSELDAALFVFGRTVNTLMMVHRLDTAIHSKLLMTILNELPEQGYARAYQEMKKLHIQDVADEREWIVKKLKPQ